MNLTEAIKKLAENRKIQEVVNKQLNCLIEHEACLTLDIC